MTTNEQPTSEGNTKTLLSKTLKTASFVFILSGLTKFVNLFCNIILMRLISKESFGTIKIYFEFAFLLMLYFPRETIRKTAQKYCADKDPLIEEKKFRLTCQLFFCIAMIMHLMAIVIFFLFVVNSGEDVRNNKSQLLLYIISGAIELYGEPIIMYMNLHIELKQVAVTIGNFGRILTNVFLALYCGMDLWSFTIARIVGSSLFILYLIYLNKRYYHQNYLHFIPNPKALLYEKEIDGINIIELRETYLSFIQTTLIKMVMTQFEKIVLGFILNHSTEEKSEYSFIIDNFSFFSRFLLEPIEETFYNLINKTKNKTHSNKDDKGGESLVLSILRLFIKAIGIFGMLLIGYFFVAGKETIKLVYTEKWATPSTHKIGNVYSIYLAIISVNGLIEAFANATNTIGQMGKRNLFFIVNSILQIILLITLSKIDITGLIYANGICMLLRIFGTLYIIFGNDNDVQGDMGKIIKKSIIFLTEALMSLKCIISIIGCVSLLYWIKVIMNNSLKYTVGFGAIIGGINLLLIVYIEKNDFVNEFNKIKND